MARVSLVDLHESDDPTLREFASKVSRPDGSIGGHFAAEAHFPEVLTNVYDARLAIARDGDLGNRLFVKLSVAVSMANGCVYCTGAYSTHLSRQLGSDEEAREYHRALRDGDLDDGERDVVGFALAVLDDPGAVSDEDFARLRERRGFTDRTFVELVYVVNVVSGYNRLTMAFDLGYDHDFPMEWAREAAAWTPRADDPDA